MIRRAFGRLIFLALLVVSPLGAGDALAQASDPFSVRGVRVDVTSETAEAARATAIAQGQARAWERLMQRLVLSGDLARAPAADQTLLQQVIEGFSVANEKTSNVRYIADFTVRFRAQAVRDVLQRSGLPYAETQSRPVVVVPIWGEGASATLWEGENPWAQAWRQGPFSGELVPFVVPLGDVSDVIAIDIAQAQAGASEALTTIANNYQAESALVAQAVERGGQLTITATLYRPGGSQPVNDTLQLQEGESVDQLLRRAAARQAGNLQEGWKQANLLRFDQQASLSARVPISSLQEWVEIQNRMGELAQVRGSQVEYLTRSEVGVTLTYLGSVTQLQNALASRQITLEQLGFDNYVLSLAAGVVPDAPPAPNNATTWQHLAAGITDVPAPDASAGEPSADGTGGTGNTTVVQ